MTIFEGIEEAAEIGRNTMASLIQRGLQEGLSANAMQRQAIDAGIGMRRGDFLQLVGEVRAEQASRAVWAEMAGDSIPGDSAFAPWSGGTPGTYLYRTTIYVREGPPGARTISRRAMDVMSPTKLSPDEVRAKSQEYFDQGLETDSGRNEEFLGAEIRNAWKQAGAA